MTRLELKEIADKANKHKHKREQEVLDIVNIILDEAKQAAENGKYTLVVDKWCGDYVPQAGEVCKALEKKGFTIYSGAAYCYYIEWKRS